MSYDIAVWEGVRPSTDDAARAAYEEHYERYMVQQTVPPSSRIQQYVAALLERWPDIDAAESSPWSDSPLIGNASGSMVYLGIVYSRADEVSTVVARIAAEHGLVCFDPQTEHLRP